MMRSIMDPIKRESVSPGPSPPVKKSRKSRDPIFRRPSLIELDTNASPPLLDPLSQWALEQQASNSDSLSEADTLQEDNGGETFETNGATNGEIKMEYDASGSGNSLLDRHYWNDDERNLLLTLYLKNQHRFKERKHTGIAIWEEIAGQIRKELSSTVTGHQCHSKLRNMKRTYLRRLSSMEAGTKIESDPSEIEEFLAKNEATNGKFAGDVPTSVLAEIFSSFGEDPQSIQRRKMECKLEALGASPTLVTINHSGSISKLEPPSPASSETSCKDLIESFIGEWRQNDAKLSPAPSGPDALPMQSNGLDVFPMQQDSLPVSNGFKPIRMDLCAWTQTEPVAEKSSESPGCLCTANNKELLELVRYLRRHAEKQEQRQAIAEASAERRHRELMETMQNLVGAIRAASQRPG